MMTKNKNNTLYAINTRIPFDLADKMNSHLAITKKSASAFIMDAIVEYLEQNNRVGKEESDEFFNIKM